MNPINKKFKSLVAATLLLVFSLLSNFASAAEYVLDPDWPKPLPDGITWGQVTIDQDGFIYAFHRADPPVLKFRPTVS